MVPRLLGDERLRELSRSVLLQERGRQLLLWEPRALAKGLSSLGQRPPGLRGRPGVHAQLFTRNGAREGKLLVTILGNQQLVQRGGGLLGGS